jgi:hypothetical protein
VCCNTAQRDRLDDFRGSPSMKSRNPPPSRTATVRFAPPGGYMTHQGAVAGFAHLRVGVSVSPLPFQPIFMHDLAYIPMHVHMPVSHPMSPRPVFAPYGLLPNSHLGTPRAGESSPRQLRKCHHSARQPLCSAFFCIKSIVTHRKRVLSTQGCVPVGPPPDKRTVRHAKSYSTCICAGHRLRAGQRAHYTNEASAT